MKCFGKMIPLFDLSLQLNGFQIKKAKAELRNIQSIPEHEFEAFIENKKLPPFNPIQKLTELSAPLYLPI